MNQSRLRRAIQISLGGMFLSIPLLIVLAAYAPANASVEPSAPSYNNSLWAAFTLTETQIAQTATSSYQTALPITQTFIAQTQTSIPRTQTAVAGQQTAVAATRTAQAQPTGTAQYIDIYEPNNSFQEAHVTTKGSVLPRITLWPLGDVDYFQFFARANTAYEVFTSNLDGDLDTVLTVYDPSTGFIGENDDYVDTRRDSKVEFVANYEGYYFIKVENNAPTDPANKTYRLEVKEVQLPTATPTLTPVADADVCDGPVERNDTFQTACLIIDNESPKQYDFVPARDRTYDEDFFRLWARQGYLYTCETSDLGSFTDTKMHVLNQFGEPIGFSDNQDGLADLSSLWEGYPNYTGWLYFQILPIHAPEYELSNLYRYKFGCTSVFVTPTPVPTWTPLPTNTFTPRPPSGGGGGTFPSRTPTRTPTTENTFTPPPPVTIVVSLTPEPPTPTPAVTIQPLPTATPVDMPDQGQTLTLNVTVYYDENGNYTPEITEGIVDVAVALYDHAGGQLLAFGYTNDAGLIGFGPMAVSGAVRMEVPFFAYSQVIVSSQSDIRVRIAPASLPDNIP